MDYQRAFKIMGADTLLHFLMLIVAEEMEEMRLDYLGLFADLRSSDGYVYINCYSDYGSPPYPQLFLKRGEHEEDWLEPDGNRNPRDVPFPDFRENLEEAVMDICEYVF